jgi:hypothetical protein
VTRLHRGFTAVRPSGLLLACSPRMEQEPLGLHPDASHPAVTHNARQGRRQALSTGLELHLRHCRTSIGVFTHNVRPRVAPTAPPHSGPIGCRCAQPQPPAGGGRSGQDPERFPCSLWFAQRRRSPTMPLRPRRGYAAAFPRSLPGSSCPPPREFPATTRDRCAPHPAQIHQVRAGAASRGCHTPVPHVLLSVTLAGPRPSGSTGPSRLCQGCSHPPRHHPGQAAPSFTALLRQDQRRRSLTSSRTTAPHGARTMRGTRRRPFCWSWACPSGQ